MGCAMADRVEILRRYANGADLRSISTDLGVDHEEVVSVVSELGFQRGRASEELRKLAAEGHPVAAPVDVVVEPKPPKVTVTAKPPVRTGHQVLADAEAAGGRLAARAAKIREQLAELGRDLLAQAEVITAEKRVEQLRAELAAAAEQLKKLKPSAGGPPPKTKPVREWAAANGITCPKAGRIPRDVMTAYEEANRG